MAAVLGLAQLGGGEPQRSAPPAAQASAAQAGRQSQLHITDVFGRLPMRFERNDGQTDARVRFLARGPGYTLFLTPDEAVLALRKPSKDSPARSSLASREVPDGTGSGIPRAPDTRGNDKPNRTPGTRGNDKATGRASAGVETEVLRVKLVGANRNAQIEGVDRLAAGSNYFIGNDPKKWHTDVPNYARVRYRNVYPGIDLVYYGSDQRQLEYDFVLATGTDSRTIAMRFEGATRLAVNRDGDVVATLPGGGEVIQHLPAVFREHDGKREKIAGKAVLRGKDTIGFDIASRACSGSGHDCVVYIDPALAYSTYLGGSSVDDGLCIAVDSSGNAYVTGYTGSTDFPLLDGYQTTLKGTTNAFVAKLNPSASGTPSLLYSTYLGGRATDEGTGIAVDSSGNAYVTGNTDSDNFPTLHAYQSALKASYNAFVAKLDPSLSGTSSLLYSTYLGGSGNSTTHEGDKAFGIAVDSSGNAYLTGNAFSTDFPVLNAYQGTNKAAGANGPNAFVAKLNPSLSGASSLLYSTYLGGSYYDVGNGIAVDSSGNAYVTGNAASTDFPTFNGYQSTCPSAPSACRAVFVAKLNPSMSGVKSLLYSTYLGGTYMDEGNGIAVDSSGKTYVTGEAQSTDFPTLNAYQHTCPSASSAFGCIATFVAKLDPSLSGTSSLLYSTYLGGSYADVGAAMAVDSSGDAYVTGLAESTDFPTLNAYQSSCPSASSPSGCHAIFVAKLDPSSSGSDSLLYSTYLGGSSADYCNGIAVDSSGNAYVTGGTASTDFPTYHGYQDSCPTSTGGSGVCDAAFVTELSPPTPVPTATATATPTASATSTAAPTVTATPTGSATRTATPTATASATATPTVTATATPTATTTAAPTATASPTPTATSTPVKEKLSITPKTVSFKKVTENTVSKPVTVTIKNAGSGKKALPVIMELESVSASAFQIVTGTEWTGTLAPGQSCNVQVTCTPPGTGRYKGALTISDNALHEPQTVNLRCTGAAQKK